MFTVIIPVCFLKFIFNINHLLNRLLSLEFISLSFMLGFREVLNIYEINRVYLLYFLVIIVCEGVLGLRFLVLIRFNYGNDYLFNYNNLAC